LSKKSERKVPPKPKRRTADAIKPAVRARAERGGAVLAMPPVKKNGVSAKGAFESKPTSRAGKPRPRISLASAGSLRSEEKLRIYRMMVRVRGMEERMLSLQRQGRIGFYGSSYGQEAATLGSAAALDADDWIFPGLREASAMLLRGYPLVPWLAQLFGNQGDPTKGRQMPSHQGDRGVHQASWSSVIGTQLPQAVGAAYAAKLRGEKTVVAAYFGDGATSSSAFSQALLFAKRLAAPVVFLCQNNHWSISVPLERQTAETHLYRKGEAFGIESRRVDGNSVDEVYRATAAAVARARSGGGPSMLELYTYRLGAHSTSDDPSRYRDQKEVDAWLAKDPVARAKRELIAAGAWSEAKDRAQQKEAAEAIGEGITAAEAFAPPPAESLFEDVYADSPWTLAEQRALLLNELAAAPRQRP
jgi:pyruvate dehydrogenase E1 component alpha subunit